MDYTKSKSRLPKQRRDTINKYIYNKYRGVFKKKHHALLKVFLREASLPITVNAFLSFFKSIFIKGFLFLSSWSRAPGIDFVCHILPVFYHILYSFLCFISPLKYFSRPSCTNVLLIALNSCTLINTFPNSRHSNWLFYLYFMKYIKQSWMFI